MGKDVIEPNTAIEPLALEKLADENLLVILEHLDLKTLSEVRAVSRRLRGVIDTYPQLWLKALNRESDERYYAAFLNQNPAIKGPGCTQSLLGWARDALPQHLKHTTLIDTTHIQRPLRAPIAGHQNWVFALALLPDGRLVSGSWDKTIKIWDVETGELERTLVGHADSVSALALLPDGRLASASDDKTIKIWDLKTGAGADALPQTLVGHENYVRALAVLPDGRLVSGSDDNTIKIWDVKTGVCLQTWSCDAWISSIAYQDGSLYAGLANSNIQRFDFTKIDLTQTSDEVLDEIAAEQMPAQRGGFCNIL